MNIVKQLYVKAKLKFTKFQLNVRDFTKASHTAYYEIFLDGAKYMIRIYDNTTHKVLEEVNGVVKDIATVRKASQIAVHTLMQKYEVKK